MFTGRGRRSGDRILICEAQAHEGAGARTDICLLVRAAAEPWRVRRQHSAVSRVIRRYKVKPTALHSSRHQRRGGGPCVESLWTLCGLGRETLDFACWAVLADLASPRRKVRRSASSCRSPWSLVTHPSSLLEPDRAPAFARHGRSSPSPVPWSPLQLDLSGGDRPGPNRARLDLLHDSVPLGKAPRRLGASDASTSPCGDGLHLRLLDTQAASPSASALTWANRATPM
jgi:hypothetical protein